MIFNRFFPNLLVEWDYSNDLVRKIKLELQMINFTEVSNYEDHVSLLFKNLF